MAIDEFMQFRTMYYLPVSKNIFDLAAVLERRQGDSYARSA
jgi:hypothetical protein